MRTVLALGLMLTLASAACAHATDDGGGVATARSATPTPGSSSSAPAATEEDAALKYAQCMREHGMTWFPDPQPGGRMTIRTPKGLDPKKMDAAQKACVTFAPNGGPGRKADPELIEQGRRLAKCMRANGVPDFPDPQPDGGISINRDKISSGPGEPAFDKAEQACARYRPSPPPGGDGGTQQGQGTPA
jgi:hypothetical protein